MRLAGMAGSRSVCEEMLTQTHNLTVLGVFLVLGSLLAGGCRSTEQKPAEESIQVQPSTHTQAAETPQATPAQEPKSPEPAAVVADQEISLFDGQTLGQWKSTDFGGQGDVSVKDGAIHMEIGSYMTGITWTGPVVRRNYEITLEAMRVEGNDFFCGLTFPVGDKPCTLVLGGWGGSVCGLSTIDYYDASENQTTRINSFEKGKWYQVRLRVEANLIQAWLDDEELVNFDTTDHKLGIRAEVDLLAAAGDRHMVHGRCGPRYPAQEAAGTDAVGVADGQEPLRPSFSRSIAEEIPATRTCLTGLVWPAMMSIWFFLMPSCPARYATRHWLALPFSGGAATRILTMSSKMPATVVRLLPGTILAVKTTPPASSWMAGLGMDHSTFSRRFAPMAIWTYFSICSASSPSEGNWKSS